MARRRPTRRRSPRRLTPLPVYAGPFGPQQAERLLWRAGFGPKPGQAQAMASLGLDGAVRSLTRPEAARLEGAGPVDDKDRPIAPGDAWGHEVLWWLDRMVRTTAPLAERMTLVWHDWFATSDAGVGSSRLMLAQNAKQRRHALGSFRTLTLDMTRDPAMLLWLSGSSNNKWSPNENYARELMELFTLGAGRGYSERDVREQARALTGFRNDWSAARGSHNFRYDKTFHDPGAKQVFGKRGRYGWQDAVDLCLRHPKHPSFVVRKLWSYFIPTPIPAATQRALEQRYTAPSTRYQIRPLIEAILRHPDMYEGPRMTKAPVVYIAGLLRAIGRPVDTEAWGWAMDLTGQRLFFPPNVAGWDETRWLDTSTWRGRWTAVNVLLEDRELDVDAADGVDLAETPAQAVTRALAFWGDPTISDVTRQRLELFAQRAADTADKRWKVSPHMQIRQNALRQLVATSPDLLTS